MGEWGARTPVENSGGRRLPASPLHYTPEVSSVQFMCRGQTYTLEIVDESYVNATASRELSRQLTLVLSTSSADK